MPNFTLVSLNARFLLKIDLICLANAAGHFHAASRTKFAFCRHRSAKTMKIHTTRQLALAAHVFRDINRFPTLDGSPEIP